MFRTDCCVLSLLSNQTELIQGIFKDDTGSKHFSSSSSSSSSMRVVDISRDMVSCLVQLVLILDKNGQAEKMSGALQLLQIFALVRPTLLV